MPPPIAGGPASLSAMTTDHADPVAWRRGQFALAAIFAFAVVLDLLGNLVLPDAWYVPANLAAAALLLVATAVVLTCWFPVVLIIVADPDPGPLFANYVGLLLLF